MGFFSQDCALCGHPMLSPQATIQINRWMSEGVAVALTGDVHSGEYDGFGRLGGADAVGFDATVWHRACWVIAGRPTDYRGASESSADQGWFFGDDEHAIEEPRH